jgi:hypothetical protein
MRVTSKYIYIPPLEKITEEEFGRRVCATDVLLVVGSTPILSQLLRWGQRLMLRRLGYDVFTSKMLPRYVHAMTVVDPKTLRVIDAVPPVVRYTNVSDDWGGLELMHLKLNPTPSTKEVEQVLGAAPNWIGVQYDIKQYFLYPYYMAWGWAPINLQKFWDDPDKPVCSGLCIRLHQAADRFQEITNYPAYPPARMPTIPGYKVVARFIVQKSLRAQTVVKPLWLR